MPSLEWVSTEMRTGLVIADLPDLGVTSLAQTLGRYESVTATLPLPTAPENWDRATLEGAATLVLLQDGVPIWGGFVSKRARDEGDLLSLSLMTLEGYLDRRYVGDETFTAVGQNSIVATLVESLIVDGVVPGIPLRVQFTTASEGMARDRQFFDTDDKTVYSAIQDLAGVIGGPEWTIGWEHLANPERYTPVLYVGDRVGVPITAGLGAAATFEMPGAVSSFEFSEDFGVGKGANSVMAFSSGQGTLRPQSEKQTVSDVSRPTFEYRYSPSSSITVIETLTGHAQGKLGQLTGGTVTVGMTAILSDAPKLGVDWFIGDDVGYVIGGVDSAGVDTVPAFPGGLKGIARPIGFQIDLSGIPTITPVLAGTSL
jgi:hypothetical protein